LWGKSKHKYFILNKDFPENSAVCDKLWKNMTVGQNTDDSTRGADMSLTRPGKKQVTTTADFEFHISSL